MTLGEAFLLVRLVKLLAVAALFAGSAGALLPRDLRDRRRAAYVVAGPAFGVTWLAGFFLVYVTSTSLLSTWILLSLFLSFVSINAVLYAVGRDGRRTLGTSLAVLVPLVATVALMVYRPA